MDDYVSKEFHSADHILYWKVGKDRIRQYQSLKTRNKSDIYFICRLSPLSHEIVIQQSEIEESRWMPVQDYLASEYVSAFNKQVVRAAIESPGVSPTWIDGYSDARRYEFFMPLDNQ